MNANSRERGFSLIEVLVAIAIIAIIVPAIIAAFWNIQVTSSNVDQRTNLAINSRGAISLVEDAIRLIGFNPAGDMNSANKITTAAGGFLVFNRNELDDLSAVETVSIGLLASEDDNGGGRDGFADHGATSLVIAGGNVADDIAALRFAYAFDDDGDGSVDLSNGNVLWAIDTDGDNDLDTLLDTDANGVIDINDAVGGAGMVDEVRFSRIRAVRIWMVVRSSHVLRNAGESGTFVVGDRRYVYNEDFAHNLFTTTIRLRNMM